MKRLLPLVLLVSGCVSAAKFKASEASLKDARAFSTSLSKDLDAARARLAALEADLSAAKASVASLSASEAELKTKLGESETKLASASDQVASLQKSVADLRQALEANKGELSRKVSELIKEKDALGQRLASTESAAAQAKAAKERELAELGRRHSALDARAKELELRGSEIESRLEDLEGRLAAAEKDKAALEDEKARLQQAKDAELAAVTKSYEELAAGLKAEISAGEVTISSLKGKLTVNLVDRILFDSGSAEVKPAGRKVLARVGALLNQVQDKDIRIEGHTDNVPISPELRGRYASNWELSTARATAVARYLQDQAKVDPKRLVAAGLGEWRPVADNSKPEQRALNRRIEIILVARD